MSSPPPSFRQKKSVMELLASVRPDEHYPLSAMIEIADRCNETCVHCYQVQGQKGELPTDDWKRILDELADMGVLLLTISGGEATLRKDLFELIAHARKRSFAIKLYTNGLNMTREMAARLAELGVMEVQISLYSHEPSIHDGITCVPGSFEKTVAAARHLREHGVAVVLKTPLMSMNHEGIDEYVALVQSVGADFMVDPTLDPREDGDAAPERYRMDREAHIAALRHPSLARPEAVRGTRSLEAAVCGACSGHVHIEANGELRPCTQLQVPVGHALHDGVRAAWEGHPAAREIRELTWAHLPGCRICDLRSVCGRCFAVARVEAADALAPYPSACARARATYEAAHGATSIEVGERPGVEVGPYRQTGPVSFVTVSAQPTPEDRARAERPWARAPEALIQIRRRTEPRLKSTEGQVP